jgi:hypothetical protein
VLTAHDSPGLPGPRHQASPPACGCAHPLSGTELGGKIAIAILPPNDLRHLLEGMPVIP